MAVAVSRLGFFRPMRSSDPGSVIPTVARLFSRDAKSAKGRAVKSRKIFRALMNEIARAPRDVVREEKCALDAAGRGIPQEHSSPRYIERLKSQLKTQNSQGKDAQEENTRRKKHSA
mmetsp:Transcript_3538/g.10678  ORF Transcript_3538/g.10678 Transcript_3538/m.10678 type:complete len:117 (+) Transcript_3538:181-531(+)